MIEPTANEVFQTWIRKEIAPLFKGAGWSKSGLIFRLRRPGLTGVVSLQKSPWSRRDRLWFWLTAGVWSERLARVDARVDRWRQGIPSGDREPHWILYFSDIMSKELSWEMSADASTERLRKLGEDVRERLTTLVIPQVIAHCSTEAIKSALQAGYEPLHGFRAAYLLELLWESGPSAERDAVEAELRAEWPAVAMRLKDQS